MHDKQAKAFLEAVLTLDRVRAQGVLEEAQRELNTSADVIEGLVIPALERIGERWEAGDLALAQVYMGGRICEELIEHILPDGYEAVKTHPTVAMGVLEDFHLLGKRLVLSALRTAGYHVQDLGGGLHARELARRVRAENIQILLISTLMLPSALHVKALRQELDDAGMSTRLVVGGAPFRLDPLLWREVGADAMGYSASDALRIVHGLCREVSG